MSWENRRKRIRVDETGENARIGYQVATNLWAYEGNAAWSAFNAMLVANSVVLATEGIAEGIIKKWLPLFGMFLCFMWYCLTSRGFHVMNYRVLASREIEETYLRPIKTVSLGGRFHDGEQVVLFNKNINDTQTLRLSFIERYIRGNIAAKLVIWAFGLLHALFFLIYWGIIFSGDGAKAICLVFKL